MNQKEQFNIARSALQSGNAQKAARLCDQGLEHFPGDANLLCLAAQTKIAQRKFDAAEPHIKTAIKMFPDYALAHETLGDLLLVKGQISKALPAYQTAMRLDSTRDIIHKKIEHIRELEKKSDVARARPNFDAQLRRAQGLEQNGDHKSAETIYRDILTKDPNNFEAARLLAGIAVLNKHFRDAEVFLKKVVSNVPGYVRAWVDLVNVQRELDKYDDALESAKKVITLAPESAESYMVYASAIGMSGDHAEAIKAYQKALNLAPDRAGALCSMAHHQKTIGQQDDAIASYRRAIQVKPDHAESYWSLANLKTFRFEANEIDAMLALLDDEDLPETSRAQLHNALGLEFEAQKDYDKAYDNFSQCNVARRLQESYDPVDTEDTYGRIIDLFTPEFVQQKGELEKGDITPIFIVGLPRSGSTLIEQILASHSQVDGTHELGDLARSIQSVRRNRNQGSRFPEALKELDIEAWQRIGKEYLSRTEVFRSGAPYFVDKNPNNFIYTGILKITIPNAKIINARRHPLDSCFGSFKQLFASGQPFTYDMTELGEYYLQYQRLMDFWHETLPNFVLDVHYEEVVSDLETQVRKVLQFCGLPFEESCLHFHETERAVKTASSEQVRQPIYSSSIDLWRNYEQHLSELVQILEPLLEELPTSSQPLHLTEKSI
mgnify:FL=1